MKKCLCTNKFIFFIIGLFIGMIFAFGTIYAATLIKASDVIYDNTSSSLSSTNVQSALKELYSRIDDYCPQGMICSNPCFVVSGTGFAVGNEVSCLGQVFYIYDNTGDNVKLLAKYNLNVSQNEQSADNSTVTVFSNSSTDYSQSLVKTYVDNYASKLKSEGVIFNEVRLITKDELESSSIGCVSTSQTCSGAPWWIYSTSYWTSTSRDTTSLWYIKSNNTFYYSLYNYAGSNGVRPVIVMEKSQFN